MPVVEVIHVVLHVVAHWDLEDRDRRLLALVVDGQDLEEPSECSCEEVHPSVVLHLQRPALDDHVDQGVRAVVHHGLLVVKDELLV